MSEPSTEPSDEILDEVLTGKITLTAGLEKNYGVSNYGYVGVREFHEFEIRLLQKLLVRLGPIYSAAGEK